MTMIGLAAGTELAERLVNPVRTGRVNRARHHRLKAIGSHRRRNLGRCRWQPPRGRFAQPPPGAAQTIIGRPAISNSGLPAGGSLAMLAGISTKIRVSVIE